MQTLIHSQTLILVIQGVDILLGNLSVEKFAKNTSNFADISISMLAHVYLGKLVKITKITIVT